MLARSAEAIAAASRHGWQGSTWSAAATTMIAHAALLRADPPQAQRLAAEGLALRPGLLPPPLRFALQAVHGAATFDQGHRANGLAELQQARSELGDHPIGAEQAASAAVLEFHAALQLGHTTAARTVYSWLTERTHHNAELLVMRAWAESAGGRHEHARTVLRPVLDGTTPALLPHTLVDAWLLETTLAMAADERPAARRALQTALPSPNHSTPYDPSPTPAPESANSSSTNSAASDPPKPSPNKHSPPAPTAKTGTPPSANANSPSSDSSPPCSPSTKSPPT